MLIAEWIMKKVMNDNAASTAAEAPATATTTLHCPTVTTYCNSYLIGPAMYDAPSNNLHQRRNANTMFHLPPPPLLHMASINRKRKFESRLPSSFDSADTKKSNTFQRPISRYPSCVSTSEQTHAAKDEVFNSFVSKQIIPKDLTYNDVVFFGPDYDTLMLGISASRFGSTFTSHPLYRHQLAMTRRW